MRRESALRTDVFWGIWLALGLVGCEPRPAPNGAGPSEPSPNASILPAPLATGLDTERPVVDAGAPDASVASETTPPAPTREDQPLPPDNEEVHDLAGITLRARFRWPDVPLPPRLPELNADALERARAAASFDLDVTILAAGRLHVALASSRFVLPLGSEFRSRTGNYGHALVWPDASRYVVVQAGALRSLLNERRTDVVPLAHVTGTPRGASQALGFSVERLSLPSALGRLELEQAHVVAAGAGAALLCRFLVELAGVHPDSPACRAELLPVRAEFAWTDGGRIVFEVSALERSGALELSSLRAPPATAAYRIGEVPVPPTALLAERAQLRSIRLRPAPGRPAKDAPKDGLLLANGDDLLRYALVDGLPVARLEAKRPSLVLDLLPGTYAVSARTFLADELTAPALTIVPGRFVTAETPRQESGAVSPSGVERPQASSNGPPSAAP